MARKTPTPEPENRFIHAPIEAVYRAFLEPPTLREWLGVDLVLVPELNGKYCVTAPGDDSVEGTIVIIAWPEVLAITWDGGSLELTLTPDFGGTQADLNSEGSMMWSGALAKLDAYLQRPGRR